MFQLRSMLAPGQRQAQGVEQRLALAAGRRLQRLDPAGEAGRRDPAAAARPRPPAARGSVTTGRQRPAADLPPLAGIVEPVEVAADRRPRSAASIPPSPSSRRRGATSAKDRWCSTAAEKRGRSSTTSLGAALPKSASEKPATSSSMPRAGSAAWAVPSAASVATMAKGSMPCSRRLRRLRAPSRLENCRPAASAISGRWAKARRRVVQGRQDRQLEGGVADMVLAANDVA